MQEEFTLTKQALRLTSLLLISGGWFQNPEQSEHAPQSLLGSQLLFLCKIQGDTFKSYNRINKGAWVVTWMCSFFFPIFSFFLTFFLFCVHVLLKHILYLAICTAASVCAIFQNPSTLSRLWSTTKFVCFRNSGETLPTLSKSMKSYAFKYFQPCIKVRPACCCRLFFLL